MQQQLKLLTLYCQIFLNAFCKNKHIKFYIPKEFFNLPIISIFFFMQLAVISFFTSSFVGFLRLLLINHCFSQVLYFSLSSSDNIRISTSNLLTVSNKICFLCCLNFSEELLYAAFSLSNYCASMSLLPNNFAKRRPVWGVDHF